MFTTHLVCYADKNMLTSQKLCCESAYKNASIEKIHPFSPFDYDREFFRRNIEILNSPQRGGGTGFWLFKPYYVDKVVSEAPTGDYVIYADAGVEFLPDSRQIHSIIKDMELAGQSIFLFGNYHQHLAWCKAEVAMHMLATTNLSGYMSHEQVQASVIIMKVNDYTRAFCKRWLLWSQMPGFIDDTTRIIQLPIFKEHRNDQSILTNLAITDNINLHWWPVQYGHHIRARYPKDRYSQMFYHHRYRENDWKNINFDIEGFTLRDKTK